MGYNTKGSVSEKGESFLRSWATVSFSMTLLGDVNYFACFQRKMLAFDSEPYGSFKTFGRFGKHCNDVSLFLVNVMDRRQYNESERQLGRQYTTRRKPDTDYGLTDELQKLTVQLMHLMLVRLTEY